MTQKVLELVWNLSRIIRTLITVMTAWQLVLFGRRIAMYRKILDTKVPMDSMSALLFSLKSEVLPILPSKKKNECHLILEEMLVNICVHGLANMNPKPSAHLIIRRNNSDIRFEIEDKGEAFDPVSYKPVECTGEEVGGHGVRLVQDLSNVFSYQRIRNKKNKIKIEMTNVY